MKHTDLISLYALHPQTHKSKDDGFHVYDPRGSAAQYGFVKDFILQDQHIMLQTSNGYQNIFPSSLQFKTIPGMFSIF